MSKINKIKLSGTTYELQDISATSAVSGKQDTLISGTNIKTINNESLLGSGNIDIQGGGKAISAGRGISITTGATADTVSFNLPISGTTNNNLIIGDTSNAVNNLYNSGESIVFGRYSRVKAYDSLVGGYNCSNEKGQSQVFGNNSKTKNQCEFGCGRYNNSVSGSSNFGDSGNTLFSVGNGTSESARHNAFEIRQNGDIYLSSGGTDIKLQDHLGSGGGSSYTAGDGIDITNDVISVTGKVDTSTYETYTAATATAIGDKLAVSDFNTYSGSVETALSGKQDTLSAGTNITIVDNVISAEGGGKAIEAGRGISVTTGETADTVSFNLPISAGTGTNSIKCGEPSQASGSDSFAIGSSGVKASSIGSFAGGSYSEAKGIFSMAFGRYNTTNNYGEVALGFFNKSNGSSSAAGNSSDNTLFSVGNGTNQTPSTRHNAFEIRQNGDIYLNDGSKLQDTVSATAANTTALGGLKLVKLSQSEYDTLATKDNSTLYVIVN